MSDFAISYKFPEETPQESKESDEALMLRTGSGDQRAFSRLVARHREKVVAIAWRFTGNKADGEEIAQDAFARVWINAPKWRAPDQGGTAKFSTWLYRVVVNLCIDRKRKPRWEVLDDQPEMESADEDGYQSLAKRQLSNEVARHVAALPERQRNALVLCFYEGFSNTEAADMLGLSVGAIESLLVRARRSLRDSMAGLYAEIGE